jgi:hypothetical protein
LLSFAPLSPPELDVDGPEPEEQAVRAATPRTAIAILLFIIFSLDA